MNVIVKNINLYNDYYMGVFIKRRFYVYVFVLGIIKPWLQVNIQPTLYSYRDEMSSDGKYLAEGTNLKTNI